jgi:hypothetical protein
MLDPNRVLTEMEEGFLEILKREFPDGKLLQDEDSNEQLVRKVGIDGFLDAMASVSSAQPGTVRQIVTRMVNEMIKPKK